MSTSAEQLDPADTAAPTEVRARRTSWIDLGRRGRRPALALLGFLIAALVVPAATKQWSDRAGELALKKELVSQIHTTVTEAVTVTDCTARLQSCFPEWRALNDPDVGQDVRAEADVTYSRVLVETRTDWTSGRASISSVLDAYFADSPVSHEWERHSAAVSAFMRLASAECGRAREDDTSYLQGYLPATSSDVWVLLRTDLAPDCQNTSAGFEAGYSWLAQDLLAQTPTVTRAVLDANADGYSSGAADFFRDLWPL